MAKRTGLWPAFGAGNFEAARVRSWLRLLRSPIRGGAEGSAYQVGCFAVKPKPRPMPRRYFARTVPVTLPKAQTLCFRECREATIARSCRSCCC